MFRFLCLLVLTAFGGIPASAQDGQPRLRDALALAVERFDPQGVQGLRSADIPVQLMSDALEAVAARFPPMALFGRHPNADLMLHKWDFFNFLFRPAGDTASAAMDSLIADLEQELSSGCPVVEQQPPMGVQDQLTRWDLSAASCGGQWAAEMRAVGPLLLSSWTSVTDLAVFRRLSLESNPSQPRDIRGVLRELQASSSSLAALLDLGGEPFASIGLGDPVHSIELIPDDAVSTYRDAFRLRYSVAWGDCPSGCINRHWWVYRLTPRERQGFDWEFAVELVEEAGAPLPPDWR